MTNLFSHLLRDRRECERWRFPFRLRVAMCGAELRAGESMKEREYNIVLLTVTVTVALLVIFHSMRKGLQLEKSVSKV